MRVHWNLWKFNPEVFINGTLKLSSKSLSSKCATYPQPYEAKAETVGDKSRKKFDFVRIDNPELIKK